MKVLVTGATGFTGSYLVPLLLKQGLDVFCFVRSSSNLSYLPRGQFTNIIGDLNSPESLKEALRGMDVMVNIASLGFGHADGIVDAAISAGVERVIFISTTAIFTNLNAPSKSVRLAAETRIFESNLNYTILRPTMIFGGSRDRNISRLIRYIIKYPVIPVVGSGDFMQQPIFVGDVAQAIVQALFTKRTYRKAYNISGAEPISFNRIIQTICTQTNRSVRVFHLPVKPIVSTLYFIEKITDPPIKAEQFLRLNEDKIFQYIAATQDFGFSPLNFEHGVRLQLKEMDR